MPIWLMVLILCIGMIALGFVLERGILRPMVGQPLVSVIMVTIGLSFVLQGLVAIVWGAGTRKLELPVPLAPYEVGPVFISPINVVAAVIALVFLIAFGLFFTRSRLGIAMRAVADDQQAAMVVGFGCRECLPCRGPLPGWQPPPEASSGEHAWVDSLLSLVGLKVFPVVILGGLDSIGGHCRWSDSGCNREWRLATLIPMLGRHQGFYPLCADDSGAVYQALWHLGHETIERV